MLDIISRQLNNMLKIEDEISTWMTYEHIVLCQKDPANSIIPTIYKNVKSFFFLSSANKNLETCIHD